MTAREILVLLEARHTNDLFVPECKDGSTVFGSHFRLDAWAMKRSWSKPLTTGYEIKVNRSDFMRDEKIAGYRDMCNCLYLVAPAGIVDPTEIPEYCGLLVPASTGSRLFIKKKAPFRDIEDPAELYKYILMSRARIDRLRYYVHGDRRRFWRQWLRTREIDKDFGHQVGGAIREEIKTRILSVAQDNEELVDRMAAYDEVIRILEGAGLATDNPRSLTWKVRERLDELDKGVSKELGFAMRQAETAGQRMREAVKALQEALQE
jgi:hypothetical protein